MDYLKPTRPFEITLGVREPWAVAGVLWSYMPKEAADRLAGIILAQESGQAHHEETSIRWEAADDRAGRVEEAIKLTIGPADPAIEETDR